MKGFYECKFYEDDEEPMEIDGSRFFDESYLAEQLVEDCADEGYEPETEIWIRELGTQKWNKYIVYGEATVSYSASKVE